MSMAWLLAALTTGLVGSLHCVGMCGPLAMALPLGRLPYHQRWLGTLAYHAARLMAYASLGAAIGGLGQGLHWLGWQRSVSVGAGVFLLALTVLQRGHWGSLTARLSSRWLMGPMARWLQRPSLLSFAGLGLLNGFLPCGFVYVAMAGAITTGQAAPSAFYMLAFGLGTLPALLAIRALPTLFPVQVRQRFTRLMPFFTIGLGLLLLGHGLYQPPVVETKAGAIPVCHGTLALKQR